MPTNRRPNLRRRVQSVTDEVRRFLLKGYAFFDPPPQLDELEDVWSIYGEELKSEWAAMNPDEKHNALCWGERILDMTTDPARREYEYKRAARYPIDD